MIEAHAGDLGLRWHIQKQAGQVVIFPGQPLRQRALHRHIDDDTANMLRPKLVEYSLQDAVLHRLGHGNSDLQLPLFGLTFYRGGDL
ncbi:hypothetical protein D3C77_671540 [compost metagenome]